MTDTEPKDCMSTVDKLKFIDSRFDPRGCENVINARFMAHTLVAVQDVLQEGQFDVRFEDWSMEKICDLVARSGFIK